jgi:hypothetical protein
MRSPEEAARLMPPSQKIGFWRSRPLPCAPRWSSMPSPPLGGHRRAAKAACDQTAASFDDQLHARGDLDRSSPWNTPSQLRFFSQSSQAASLPSFSAGTKSHGWSLPLSNAQW